MCLELVEPLDPGRELELVDVHGEGRPPVVRGNDLADSILLTDFPEKK